MRIANVRVVHRVEGAEPNQRVVLVASFDLDGKPTTSAVEEPRLGPDGVERTPDLVMDLAFARLVRQVADLLAT